MVYLWELRLRVRCWIVKAFSESHLLNRSERAARLLEEALELAQAEGVSFRQAKRIAARIYSRPAGLASQEAAQVLVALLGHSASAGTDLEALAAEELERMERPEVMAAIRAKQAEKSKAGTGVSLNPEKPISEVG